MAALLVREHEKAAVMGLPYDGKSIQVISVVNLNNPRSAVTASSWPIRWLASLNSRFDKPIFPENDEDSMRVVDPETKTPQNLLEHKDEPIKLLDCFLLNYW